MIRIRNPGIQPYCTRTIEVRRRRKRSVANTSSREVQWPSIERAHAALAMRKALSELFSKRSASDTSVVVFGSVARFEVTSKSDTDWILLVDGSATPEHKRQETEVEQALWSKGYIEPGQSGVFGKFVGSHDLIHRIGGEDDLN